MRSKIQKIDTSDPDYVRFIVKPVINLLVSGLNSYIQEEQELPSNPSIFLSDLIQMNQKVFDELVKKQWDEIMIKKIKTEKERVKEVSRQIDELKSLKNKEMSEQDKLNLLAPKKPEQWKNPAKEQNYKLNAKKNLDDEGPFNPYNPNISVYNRKNADKIIDLNEEYQKIELFIKQKGEYQEQVIVKKKFYYLNKVNTNFLEKSVAARLYIVKNSLYLSDFLRTTSKELKNILTLQLSLVNFEFFLENNQHPLIGLIKFHNLQNFSLYMWKNRLQQKENNKNLENLKPIVDILNKIFQNNKELVAFELGMKDNELDFEGIRYLQQNLNNQEQVKHFSLSLENNFLVERGIEQTSYFIQKFPMALEINLNLANIYENFAMKENGANFLAESLQQIATVKKNLKEEYQKQQKQLGHDNDMPILLSQLTLDITKHNIGDKGIEILIKGISTHPLLTKLSLNLKKNKIGDQGFKKLASFIQNLKFMHDLDLGLAYNTFVKQESFSAIVNMIYDLNILNHLKLDLRGLYMEQIDLIFLCKRLRKSKMLVSLKLKFELSQIQQFENELMGLKYDGDQGLNKNKIHLRKFFEDELMYNKKKIIATLKRVDILC